VSFLRYYFNLWDDVEEAAVCCPFSHSTDQGLEYYERNPSAHVNTINKLFHCKSCDKGYSETAFVSAILGCDYGAAVKITYAFNNSEDKEQWDTYDAKEDTKRTLYSYNITPKVIEELKIKTGPNNEICFPVFMYDKLLDIRKYQPTQKPKIKSRYGAVSGLIIPYDVWREDRTKTTLICAGEKDMAVARSYDFNAITITGGENALPLHTADFKGRKVVILYDNDATGKQAAIKLAEYLKPICESVKNCTDFHNVCTEKGEDVTDFFNKYNKTRADMIQYLVNTPEFTVSPDSSVLHGPIVTLHTASNPGYINKTLRSNIQVVATSEATYSCPAMIVGEKYRLAEDGKDTMPKGATRIWELTDETLKDVLHLIDNNFNEITLNRNYKSVLKLSEEKYIKINRPVKATIYKAHVTDLFETSKDDVTPMEYAVYSINCKLESGKKYLATYRLIPHPYKGQQLTMIVTSVVEAKDSVTNFKVNEQIKNNLKFFQQIEGTVSERLDIMADRFKGILGYNGENDLITILDLAYHTVLGFDFIAHKDIRGYLDLLVISESRMGKSSTAEAMRNTYELGAFVSLAGNSATIAGLVGGSNKVNGTYQTRAGIIPQNHKGLIIFEELGKSSSNILTELTDIRSSNEVRITRVSGTISLPARVRMLSLSNVKNTDSNIKPIASYPHGISIASELIGTAEDIARYDLIYILGSKGPEKIDPCWVPMQPIPEKNLKTRIRWIWSRTNEQVIINQDIAALIISEANKLNAQYGCHIKIFGTEAWKKLARLSIAIAGYLVSTDETYTNIIVEAEHVENAVRLMKKIYDNPTFKLKEYVEHERKYSTIDDDGIKLLEEVYMKSPAMLLHLELISATTKNALQAATGMDNNEYNAQMNKLVRGLFITFTKYEIVPTERFRLGMAKINRNTIITRVGEFN